MARKKKVKSNDLRLSVKKNIKPLIFAFAAMFLLIAVVVFVTFFTQGKTDSGEGLGHLYINEIMTSNQGTLIAPDGSVSDWVEIYNNSKKDINAAGYSLVLKNGKNSIVFPKETVIPAGGYIVVYCTGSPYWEGLCAPFTLAKAGGETLVLKDSDGTTLDTVTTKKSGRDDVMRRVDFTPDGWELSSMATPYYENTEDGYNKMVADRMNYEGEKKVVINEICAKNTVGMADEDGDRNDWIEVKNISSETIDLTDWSLGSSIKTPYEWQFPSMKIKPGEIVLVQCSGKDISNLGQELHTGFTISVKQTEATLSNAEGKVVDAYKGKYTNPDSSIARDDKGNMAQTFAVTPAFENNEEGFKAASKEYAPASDVIIWEAMSKNQHYIKQNGGKFYDWAEIKNVSSSDIDLSSYSLSNDIEYPEMWKFPKRTLAAGESTVVICSGNEILSSSSYYHSNFKINNDEQIYLFKDGKLVDGVCLKGTDVDMSLTRTGKDSGFYLNSKPSPQSTEDSDLKYALASKPVIETTSGVYNDTDKVKVTISGEGDIYYTLDGTMPSTSSHKYKAPFDVTETASVHAVSFSEGKAKSAMASASYIINENHTVPVMTLSLDREDFYGEADGIYALGYNASSEFPYNGANFWDQTLEKKCKAEFFEEGKDGFSIDCGLKIFGAYSRADPKKSFQLKFRDLYGEGELCYEVFDDLDDIKTFEALVLRSGSQDYRHAMVRDEFFTGLLSEYSDAVYVQAYKPCVLYINGEYFGIYYFREKINADYVAKHLNADVAQTTLLEGPEKAAYGSNAEFKELREYVESHDMRVEKYYKYAEERIDFMSLIDFTIAEFYSGNQDNGNVKWFKNTDGDGKWHWIFYDLDWAFYYDTSIDRYLREEGRPLAGFSQLNKLIYNLLKNPEFKDMFLKRFAYHLENTFNPKNAVPYLESICDVIEPEMKRERERWGGSYTGWQREVEIMKTKINNRKDFMLSELKEWFSLSSAEMDKYFGNL